MEQNDKQIKTIQSVHRALDILEYLVGTGDGFRLAKIAEKCGLNKTTAYHLLKTLESRGYVEQSYDTQCYKPGWMIYSIASKTMDNLTVVRAARPYIEQLFDRFNETTAVCHGVQKQDRKVAFSLCQAESTQVLHTTFPVGTYVPLHCTAGGKIYLSSLPENLMEEELGRDLEVYTDRTVTDRDVLREQMRQIKRQGYCVEYEEYQAGVCTVAVPVYKYTGRAIFSLVISIPIQRAAEDQIQQMLQEMIPMAKELSKMPF